VYATVHDSITHIALPKLGR